MATDITKNVTRGCPEIQNPDGRVLDARLDDEHGGSLHLKWRGLGKKSEVKFLLEELMDGGAPTYEPQVIKTPFPAVPAEKPSQVRRSPEVVPEGSVGYAQIHDILDELPMAPSNRAYVKEILADIREISEEDI